MRLALLCVSLLTLSACNSDNEGTDDSGEPLDPVDSLNGCEDSDYVDRSAAGASRTVSFGGQDGSPALGYSPACLIVSAGQSVTFQGDFGVHPFSPGTVSGSGETAGTPLTNRSSGSTPYAVTFPAPGLYPYYCELHQPGMAGVVRVK